MLKRSFVLGSLLISFTSSVYSKSIDDVVKNTLNQNYTIKSLESSINTTKEQIKLASKWENPILTFGANDIQFDDIGKRDIEAMQAQFIGFSQTIPIGDKLEIAKKIAKDDYKISQYTIEEKKLQYKSKIYEYIYKIKLLKEKLSLFKKFKSNTIKLENLLTQLYKYKKANQVQILNTKIMIQELNLKSQKLQTIINTLNLKLEQITYSKVEDIDFDSKLKRVLLSKDIESHPKILALLQRSKKQNNISQLEIEKKNSDIKMNLTYFQRDNKFEDYVNIAFAIPLSIYGTEDIKSKKAKFKTVELNHKLEDMKLTFKNEIQTYQQNMDDAIITFNIIKKDILPKFNQLQKVMENYNSHSSYKNMDSKALISNLNEIIKYELKAIDEKEKYFNALAKSYYFNKEI